MSPGTLTGAFGPIDHASHEILIVDDDPAARYATTRRLSAAGFRTLEAGTGAEALARISPSLSAILLDVHLPDMNGLDLCRQLRQRPEYASIAILQISAAYVTDLDKVRGLDSGADAYLTHPVDAGVLVATVQALIRTRAAESAMRLSEASFRAIYTNAPSGICLLDPQGRLLDANPALSRLLSRPLPELTGRRLADFVAPQDVERVLSIAEALPAAEPDARVELSLVDGVGRTIPMELHLSRHSPGVLLAQVTDVSAYHSERRTKQATIDRERDARTSAEQLNRLKDEFIAVLSHELRSPLQAIMSAVHLLLKRSDDAITQRGLKAIERAGQTQARLVSDLLDMSRLNMGKMRLSRTLVDLTEVVDGAVAALKTLADENDNPIELQVDPALPPVLADGSRLQQVVWNLVSNALKFSPRGAPVTVVLTQSEGGVRLTVRDQGRGIAPEFIPHLFERFMQAESSNQRFNNGLGLGLTIVSQLVQAHGGRVWASSEGLGRGATFEVWLPSGPLSAGRDAVLAADGEGLAGEGVDRLLQGRRLLVVDDDAEALAMLQIVLSDAGASVRIAHDHDGALAALDDEWPDLLLSDIGLPGKDGYQLITEVRRREAAGGRGPRMPAVAFTAFAQHKDREQALASGFDLHQTKPVQPLALVGALADLLAAPRT